MEVFLLHLILQKAIHFEPTRLQIHAVFVHNPLLLLCGLQRHSVLDTYSSTRWFEILQLFFWYLIFYDSAHDLFWVLAKSVCRESLHRISVKPQKAYKKHIRTEWKSTTRRNDLAFKYWQARYSFNFLNDQFLFLLKLLIFSTCKDE